MAQPWTSKRVETVCKWLDKGLSIKEISLKLEISHQAVYEKIKKDNRLNEKYELRRSSKPKSKLLSFKEDNHLSRFFTSYEDYKNLTFTEKKLLKRRIHMWKRKKYWADKHGIPFDIGFKEIVWPTVCPVLGFKLNYFCKKTSHYDRASFDRLDSTKGYVKGNVAIMSLRANILKNDSTIQEVEQVLEYMKSFKQLHKVKKDYTQKSLFTARARKIKSIETFKYKGKRLTLVELHELLKPPVGLNTFISRVRKQKWSVEDAAKTPKNKFKSAARNGVSLAA